MRIPIGWAIRPRSSDLQPLPAKYCEPLHGCNEVFPLPLQHSQEPKSDLLDVGAAMREVAVAAEVRVYEHRKKQPGELWRVV